MTNSIQIIFEFLQQFGPDVSARSAPIDDKLKEKLCLFASGKLDHTEKNTVAAELLRNPESVAFLAEQIQKVNRKAPSEDESKD